MKHIIPKNVEVMKQNNYSNYKQQAQQQLNEDLAVCIGVHTEFHFQFLLKCLTVDYFTRVFVGVDDD